MLEKQRLTYLVHLGIENYMPRRVLSGAASSSVLTDEMLAVIPDNKTPQVPVQATVQAEAETVIAPIPMTAAPSIQSILEESEPQVVNKPEKQAAVAAENNPTPKISSHTQNLRFTLTVWRIEPDVLVVDSREPGAALPTDRLLQNMLRSVGYSLAQLPSSELIRWPLFDEQQSCEQEARAMVQAYISAYCDKAASRAILLMGRNAVRFALNAEEDGDAFYDKHCGDTLMQPQWSVNVGVVPSLADMLHDPLQKRLTWQSLQTLFT